MLLLAVRVRTKSFFSAVGVLRVELNLDPYPSFKLGGKEYKLFCAGNHKRSLYAFKKGNREIWGRTKNNSLSKGVALARPKKPAQIQSFQLVGFDDGVQDGVARDLDDNEFKLFGLWQFIAVCKCPVISVYRNFTPEQYAHFKSWMMRERNILVKAQHIPLLWKDAIVPPFRFNPKVDKEQQAPCYFVGVKVRFLPGRDSFGFDSLLAPPTLEGTKVYQDKETGAIWPRVARLVKARKIKKCLLLKKVVKSKNKTETKSMDKSSLKSPQG